MFEIIEVWMAITVILFLNAVLIHLRFATSSPGCNGDIRKRIRRDRMRALMMLFYFTLGLLSLISLILYLSKGVYFLWSYTPTGLIVIDFWKIFLFNILFHARSFSFFMFV